MEVIVSGMEAFISHSFSTPYAKKPWFNHAYSLAINDREAAQKRYLSLCTPANHDLYVSAWNYTKSVLQLTKNSYINKVSKPCFF